MNKKQKDLLATLVILGMGAFLYIRSVDFPLGAKAFPQVIIISVLVLTVAMIVRSFLTSQTAAESEADAKKERTTEPVAGPAQSPSETRSKREQPAKSEAGVEQPAESTVESRTETVDPNATPGGDEQQRRVPTWQKTQPWVVLAATLLYVGLINVLGFFVTSVLFVPSLIYYLGLRGWRAVVLPSVVLLVFVYVLFVTQLRVPLPTGILF